MRVPFSIKLNAAHKRQDGTGATEPEETATNFHACPFWLPFMRIVRTHPL
jgi:hypothetical protein